MEGELIKSSAESDAISATGEINALNNDSEMQPTSHGDDALAYLMDSMEQFVADDNTTDYNDNDGAIDQKHETHGSRRSQRTNSTEEMPDSGPLFARTSDAISSKRPQKTQASSQAAKKAKKGKSIWSTENVLQNPKSPLVNANLKVCNGSWWDCGFMLIKLPGALCKSRGLEYPW